jgi:hypothetical protein
MVWLAHEDVGKDERADRMLAPATALLYTIRKAR